ncbi:uncharacterized protein I303_102342 [Kwoniella dejecticola CBS 10117]|uniref:Ricin B lectin domain-containing protein n=1 Tax=Kwoniella dejecticola CBS 10117 TaxID=1296121 RepID=A0A1A6AB83_9TREE|nr:uncharacterized protein I303_01517 [Kwoniella dejecticola CBS 10117]OBR87315.1 hypothetical protein I303_01517 [Kwoniella dejecticola CBS 10117]
MLSIIYTLLLSLALVTSSPTPELHQYDKRYNGVKIQAFRNSLCLSPIGNTLANGVVVGAVECYAARTWNINPGSGSIILAGTNFALDAGTGTQNGEGVKIWQSYSGLRQQTWYLTNDRRIAITGGNQCLDQYNDDSGTHIWQCGAGNINQIWTMVDSSGANPPVPGQPTILNPPIGQVVLDPPNHGSRIHPYQRPDLAVTVTGGVAAFDRYVDMSVHTSLHDGYALLQLWFVPMAGTTQSALLLYTANNNYCLHVGTPANGNRVRLHDCDTVENTRWDWDGAHLKVSGTNYCLDVRAESSPTHSTPCDVQKTLQIWDCSAGNHNQEFFIINRKAGPN